MCVCVVRSPDGRLTLYCKGADTIIYERLHQSCSKLMEATTEHLNVSERVNVCVKIWTRGDVSNIVKYYITYLSLKAETQNITRCIVFIF